METARLIELKKLLNRDQKDTFLLYGIGLEYLSLGQTAEASNWFKKCHQIDPKYLAVYYQLGKVYEDLDDLESARKIYRAGIELAVQQKSNRTFNELKSALEMLD